LTALFQPIIVDASAWVTPTETLQKRSFAFRPAAPQALPENPGERGGSGFLPETSLKSDAHHPNRVLEFAAPGRLCAPGGDRR